MAADDDPGPEIGYTGARFGGMPRKKARKRSAATEALLRAEEAVAEETARRDAVTEELPVVPPAGSEALDAPEEPEVQAVGLTGARFGGGPRRRRGRPSESEPPEPEPVAIAAQPTMPPLPGVEPDEDPYDVEVAGSTQVRPYVFTRGRTRPQFEMSVEALVSLVPGAPTAHMTGEHQAVVALCGEARSVAEIAALLGVPLGVARVLLGDLAAAGAVALHRTAGVAGPDMALMERVLSGLRRL